MNPFRKIANSLMNWWKGETAPEVSDSTELTGGVMTLNSPSFLESMGLSRRRKTTSEVTYFTCLKMLSETLAKMPIKYYQRKLIAQMAKAAAVNNMVGYCQSHRGTFWTNLADSNFDPAQITVPCEADCSSGVAAIVKGAGYRLKNEN
ncbi:MAG: hypothetical protein ACLTLQ_18430 [[Clostridium] scindens]